MTEFSNQLGCINHLFENRNYYLKYVDTGRVRLITVNRTGGTEMFFKNFTITKAISPLILNFSHVVTVGNVFTGVCRSIGRRCTPPGRHPSWPDTRPWADTPKADTTRQTPPRQTPP